MTSFRSYWHQSGPTDIGWGSTAVSRGPPDLRWGTVGDPEEPWKGGNPGTLCEREKERLCDPFKKKQWDPQVGRGIAQTWGVGCKNGAPRCKRWLCHGGATFGAVGRDRVDCDLCFGLRLWAMSHLHSVRSAPPLNREAQATSQAHHPIQWLWLWCQWGKGRPTRGGCSPYQGRWGY